MPSLVLPRSQFLHVPKTGGNWVSRVLSKLFPDAQRMQKRHTGLADAPRPELFTFTFVRHPLTWYQSYFSYKRLVGWDDQNEWDLLVRCESFAEFVDRAVTITPGYYSKMLRRYVGSDGIEVDFVGRFELLHTDLICALEEAGESFSRERLLAVPPVNQSDYQRFPAVYTRRLEQQLLNVEAEAIERFYSRESVAS